MVDVYVVNNGYVDLGGRKIKVEDFMKMQEERGNKCTTDNHFVIVKH